jgi:hypothetical protein
MLQVGTAYQLKGCTVTASACVHTAAAVTSAAAADADLLRS